MQVFAHCAVKATQEHVTAVQQRRLGAQAVEDPCELHGDVAATHHQHALGQFFEEERFIGADCQLMPRNLRDLRPAARCDQDMFGRMTLAIDFNLVGPGQFGVAFHQGDATVDQQVAVNTVEAELF